MTGYVRVVAADLSLASTGRAHNTLGPVTVTTINTDAGMPLAERLHRVVGHVLAYVTAAVDMLVVEDVPATRNNAAAHLGMVHGALRYELHRRNLPPPVTIPPASLKKYATGKGNASKNEVLAEAIRRLGYQGASHDEADALWLHAMACDHLGAPPVPLPAGHRAALDRVNWEGCNS